MFFVAFIIYIDVIVFTMVSNKNKANKNDNNKNAAKGS
jgi:hypothetical protein